MITLLSKITNGKFPCLLRDTNFYVKEGKTDGNYWSCKIKERHVLL